jgi:hypothetical protein
LPEIRAARHAGARRHIPTPRISQEPSAVSHGFHFINGLAFRHGRKFYVFRRDTVTPADTTYSTPKETEAEDLESPDVLPDVRIYSHSSLLYWWPVWLSGFIFAAVTYFPGGVIELDEVRRDWFHDSSGVGLTYVLILFFVIIFTNIKLRGIYSIVLILAIGLAISLVALAGWWDEVMEFIPYLSVHMNMGFYVVFSTLLLVLWLLMFFVFDRMNYWVVRPGQLTRVARIGGNEETWDTRGLLVEERADDYFRHYLLGLGAGDLTLTTSGGKKETIRIPNVVFADRKVDLIQRLVAVEPHTLMENTGK